MMAQRAPRRLIAIRGERDELLASMARWLADVPCDEIVWLGDRLPAGLQLASLSRREQWLGDEYRVAVIDGWAGFDPEQFGALSGTLQGGGVLVLLLPSDASWCSYPDPAKGRIALWPHTPATMPNRFIARALRILHESPAVEWCSTDTLPPLHLNTTCPGETGTIARTPTQQQAIAALHHVVAGHRHRPLVLMADRGRGKSSALGMGAAELLRSGMQRIIVTAPHRNAVHSLLRHAALATAEPHLEFIPPDVLLREEHPCDLLLVDEAAAIPAPLLEALLQRYPRIAFATTVHGYEGTGRGFALRFFKVLDRLAPGWQLLELREPVRWGVADPLETLANRLLLLDAEPADDHVIAATSREEYRYEQLEVATLLHDEALLREIFGLLLLAHYRTTPLDLRQLLDSPNVSLHLLRSATYVAAVALTLREGGFDAPLAHEIYMGHRRPRGHLAPQALAFYCGMASAPQLTTERVMRIAVHPALQHKGLGTHLIEQIAREAEQQGRDYLSASFGATPELLRFWRRNSLLPLRVAMGRDASSGYHSVLVMRPFSAAAQEIFQRVRQRFLNHLPLQLSEPLQSLEQPLIMALLDGEQSVQQTALDDDDKRDLHSFAYGKRGYEVCMGAIDLFVRQSMQSPALLEALPPRQRELLLGKVVQRLSWAEVVKRCGLQGAAEGVSELRNTLQQLLHAAADDLPDAVSTVDGQG